MANNRLFIGCKRCAEWAFLDKHFGGPFVIDDKGKETFNAFVEKHAYCNRDGSIAFELFDENTDDPKTWSYYFEHGFKESAEEITEV